MQTIKHADIEADIDVELGLVTLRLRDFDSQAVADFVTDVLPQHGAVAYQGHGQAPSFQLAIFLGGRRHTAHVVSLADGRTTVRLDCPFEEHKRRLHKAAARALQLLHEAGWQAIVIGDVPSGTITWDSVAEVRFDDREREMSNEEFGKLGDRLQAEASYAVFVERASIYVAGTFEDMLRMPHLTWDSESGSVAEYRHDFVSDAAYLRAWKRVRKAVDERFDIRGSSLVALVNICFDHRGSIPDEWRARMADQVQDETFDFVEHEVRREREEPGAVHRPSRDLQGKLEPPADLDAPVADVVALRRGTVSRLNQGAGFGYVDDDDGVHSYIFVFGHAIKHSDARQLSVRARVRFRVEERGRVSKLQLA